MIDTLTSNASNRLKRQGEQEYRIASVLGHANETMSTGRYGGPLEARDLLPVVELLDFRRPLEALFDQVRVRRDERNRYEAGAT